MYSFTKHQPRPDIRLQSSIAEIREKLHGRGVLADPGDPIENIMFRTHVLEPHISQMSHVQRLLRQLDVDSKMRGANTACAKAQHTRAWMAQEHGGAPDLTWAIMGLAIARHTGCDCHETGSFQPGRRIRRARLNSRSTFLDGVLAFLRIS